MNNFEDEDELLTVYQNSNYIKDLAFYIVGFVIKYNLNRIKCKVCANEIKREKNFIITRKKNRNRGGFTMLTQLIRARLQNIR